MSSQEEQKLLTQYKQMFPQLKSETILEVVRHCQRDQTQIVDSLLNLNTISSQSGRTNTKPADSINQRGHAAAVSKPKDTSPIVPRKQEIRSDVHETSITKEIIKKLNLGTVHQQFFEAIEKKEKSTFLAYYFDQVKPFLKDLESLDVGVLVAVESGRTDLLEYFFQNGCSVEGLTKKFITPLILALTCGQIKCAELLVSKFGADINAKHNGASPIQLAIKKKSPSLVAKMVRRNVDLKVVDSEGRTPLHMAILEKDFEIMDILVEKAPLTVGEGRYGDTPLHTCIRYLKDTNDVMLFLNLVKSGMMTTKVIDTVNAGGQTPLMIAVERGLVPVVEQLIKKNANPLITDLRGAKPLDVARFLNLTKIAEKLIQHTQNYTPTDVSFYANVGKSDPNNNTDVQRKLTQKNHDDFEAVKRLHLYLQDMLNSGSEYERINEEYEEIEQLTINDVMHYSFTSAFVPANSWKNRYKNILPYENTRVILSNPTNSEGGDYINANYIHMKGPEQTYIAAQGPLEGTTGDFWQMVFEQKSMVVIMLANEYEKGRQKCFRYWPEQNAPINTLKHTVSLTKQDKISEHVISRALSISASGQSGTSRTVFQIQYENWPDQGVPETPDDFLALIDTVDKLNKGNAPIVVHCSAGIGRTGTFIAVHSCFAYLTYILSHQTDKRYSIKDTVLEMRKSRVGMVQTPEQYRFIYTLIHSKIPGYLDILSIKNKMMLWTTIPEKSDANKILEGKPGHFLLRTTHSRGYIVLSVNKDNKILHAKVNISHKGFSLENSSTQYKTIEDLIKKYSYLKHLVKAM